MIEALKFIGQLLLLLALFAVILSYLVIFGA